MFNVIKKRSKLVYDCIVNNDDDWLVQCLMCSVELAPHDNCDRGEDELDK